MHITPHFTRISPSGSTDSLQVKQTRELKTVASIFPKNCTKTSLMCNYRVSFSTKNYTALGERANLFKEEQNIQRHWMCFLQCFHVFRGNFPIKLKGIKTIPREPHKMQDILGQSHILFVIPHNEQLVDCSSSAHSRGVYLPKPPWQISVLVAPPTINSGLEVSSCRNGQKH